MLSFPIILSKFVGGIINPQPYGLPSTRGLLLPLTAWFSIDVLPPWAFDHDDIMLDAIKIIKEK